eukprot:2576737-Pleurochrysis_carterae.AAC.1
MSGSHSRRITHTTLKNTSDQGLRAISCSPHLCDNVDAVGEVALPADVLLSKCKGASMAKQQHATRIAVR